MTITSFFKSTLGAPLANHRSSWGAFKPRTNQVFLRVWEDQLDDVDGAERVLVLSKTWNQQTRGFSERAKHIEAIKSGAEAFGILCEAVDSSTTRKRSIKRFDAKSLLRFGKIVGDARKVYATITGRVPTSRAVRRQNGRASLARDLSEICRRNRAVTSRQSLIKARLGQGQFRVATLALWGARCCVTGASTVDAIRASHIKPWAKSNDFERLDPYNGLPLVGTLDALFDVGLITFAEDGTLLVSPRLTNAERRLLGLHGRRLRRTPSKETLKYLAYHRQVVFDR